MEEEAPPQILEACHSCGTLIDVSDEGPFSQIHCPACGQSMRARKQFNNFTLQELIGHGGMGEVFRALDNNLQRQVALKILRKEFSVDQDGRDKLAREARLTASINHPHVVKVFSFGEARGQFYIAMELVERGTLDDLMALQRRVAEAQVLEVGIQIASGLQAGFEVGLIHRDLKPGNILFADGHTAKLVDFGLALVMDEVAAEKGEIWGTPYYIAPEKLDNQPEDFRSDIYSLGGTLFHAMAGRPPYEAETASMVALKQLKSQAVSLAAFAPDVTSETAYVINRMMAKNPEERYQSYEELIEHLNYAREKLISRAAKPKPRLKENLTVETDQQRRVVAITTAIVLAVLIAFGGFLFWQKDRVAAALGLDTPRAVVDRDAAARFEAGFSAARQAFLEGDYRLSARTFSELAGERISTSDRQWMLANEGLALVTGGQMQNARKLFSEIQKDGMYSQEERDREQANFFMEVARIMSGAGPVSPGTLRLYQRDNFEAFAFLLFGMKNWQMGFIQDAEDILKDFLLTDPQGQDGWIAEYKPVASRFLDAAPVYGPLAEAVGAAAPEEVDSLLDQVEQALGQADPNSELARSLEQLQKTLQRKKPSES